MATVPAVAASEKAPLVVLLTMTELSTVPWVRCFAWIPLALPLNEQFEIENLTVPLEVVKSSPSPVLSLMTVFLMFRARSLLSLTRMPGPANLNITQSSTLTVLA